MIALYIALDALGVLLAVLLLRAALFLPKKQKPISNEEIRFDKDAAVNALQALVQCKTISYNDRTLEDEVEFQNGKSLPSPA